MLYGLTFTEKTTVDKGNGDQTKNKVKIIEMIKYNLFMQYHHYIRLPFLYAFYCLCASMLWLIYVLEMFFAVSR